MMATLQRVEQEVVSSQSLVNAIENVSQTRSDATGGDCDGGMENDSIRRIGRAAHHLEGSHAGVAAWLGYVDPKHEAGKLIQRITKGTFRATEAWTDGRHAEDDKFVDGGCGEGHGRESH